MSRLPLCKQRSVSKPRQGSRCKEAAAGAALQLVSLVLRHTDTP